MAAETSSSPIRSTEHSPVGDAAASSLHQNEPAVHSTAYLPNNQDPGVPGQQDPTGAPPEPSQAGADAADHPSDQPADDPEERSRKLQLAEEHKQKGNDHYRAGRYDDALQEYEEAVQQVPQDVADQLAVYWANAAACHLQLGQAVECVSCCSAALEHSPAYIKALLRRSAAYEKLDELDKALKDAQQAVECDPTCAPAAAAVKRLHPVVEERNERLKAETLDKLKDLGNTLLGKFGLSLDSFQAERDPSTGSYSIKFNNS